MLFNNLKPLNNCKLFTYLPSEHRGIEERHVQQLCNMNWHTNVVRLVSYTKGCTVAAVKKRRQAVKISPGLPQSGLSWQEEVTDMKIVTSSRQRNYGHMRPLSSYSSLLHLLYVWLWNLDTVERYLCRFNVPCIWISCSFLHQLQNCFFFLSSLYFSF